MTFSIGTGGAQELSAMRRQSRSLFVGVVVFSLFANLLMLTGPLYMLQVYDRVLGARSVETLIALSAIALFLYAVMGVLDAVRGRITARIAARFQLSAERRVFEAMHRAQLSAKGSTWRTGIADLDAVVRAIGSPVLTAILDLPWVPIFFAMIFIIHPLLGLLSVSGAAALVLVTSLNQLLSARPQSAADNATRKAEISVVQSQTDAEVIQALGMQGAVFEQWQASRQTGLQAQLRVSDVNGGFGALMRTLRLILQSAMLGLGAWLVMADRMTAGGMIASSILLGRALGPVEGLLVHWSVAQRAHQGWHTLARLLEQVPPPTQKTALPAPKGLLRASNVTVIPPGARNIVLRGISFVLEPGEAIGVIGPSGAGKSTLGRVLTGVWPVTSGMLRLDGVALTQFSTEARGRYVGYLPQRVQFFDGTVAENIARLEKPMDDAKVIAAAKLAGAHKIILALSDGYDTILQANGAPLSGGQVQRIGLARALYHDPVLVVLDEPNANLDHEGSIALNDAIRALKHRGAAVLIMAHRPAAIEACDLLLVLEAGGQAAFGPKGEILADRVKNATALSVPGAA